MARIIGLLPPDAVAILKAASLVGTSGSVQRTVAIEQANERVRSLYPNLFRKEPMKVSINNVRLAFPSLFEPSSFEGSEPAYQAKFIVPADHPQIAELDAAMLKVAIEKWGAKGQTVFDNLTKTGKKPEVAFVKDAYKSRDGDTFDGFEGNYYISAKNKARPTVVDRDRTVLTQADGRPFAGCTVNAIIELWAQDNSFGRAVRASLKGVQYVKDGDAFGAGGVASTDDFAELSVADGAGAVDLA